METTASNNGLGKVKKVLPKTQKSLFELAQTIPHGCYKGLSQILEPHEIPEDRE